MSRPSSGDAAGLLLWAVLMWTGLVMWTKLVMAGRADDAGWAGDVLLDQYKAGCCAGDITVSWYCSELSW